MRVWRCPKCDKLGGHLTFRHTKNSVLRKYPYVGHYDSTKKHSRTWCSLNEKQLNSIEFVDDWYQDKYAQLIRMARIESINNEDTPRFYSLVVAAGKLLEENGFLKYKIAEKLKRDIACLVLEKPIYDTLHQKWENN